MDIYGICTRCEKQEFADDLIEYGDWYLCDECVDDI